MPVSSQLSERFPLSSCPSPCRYAISICGNFTQKGGIFTRNVTFPLINVTVSLKNVTFKLKSTSVPVASIFSATSKRCPQATLPLGTSYKAIPIPIGDFAAPPQEIPINYLFPQRQAIPRVRTFPFSIRLTHTNGMPFP